jgi:hypothetical protein
LKKIILVCAVFIICFFARSDEIKNNYMKRSITIMPFVFVNQNKVTEYDFISFLLRDTLKLRLMETNLFVLINFSDIDAMIKKHNLEKGDYEDQNKSVKVGLALKSDIVIVGKYSVVGDQIQIITNAIDIIGNRSVEISIIKGQIGPKIFDLVEQTSIQMSEKMSAEFPPIDRKILEEFGLDKNKIIYKNKTNDKDKGKDASADGKVVIKDDASDDKVIEITKKNDIVTDSIEKNLKPRSIAGICLVSSGTSFIIAGSGLLFYDFFGYMPIYKNLKDNATSGSQYEDYVNSYNTFIGLMGAGIGIITLGITLDGIGIPLIVYKEKKRELSMIIEPKINFTVGMRYRF